MTYFYRRTNGCSFMGSLFVYYDDKWIPADRGLSRFDFFKEPGKENVFRLVGTCALTKKVNIA